MAGLKPGQILAGKYRVDRVLGVYLIGMGPAAGTVYDPLTKLTWQRTVPTTTYTWVDAKAICKGQGQRLPTIGELSTLIDFTQAVGPYIDGTAFPNTPSAGFWSSTYFVDPMFVASAWPVYFDLGASNGSAQTTMFYVRCVR